MHLEARQYCYGYGYTYNYNNGCYYSSWNAWGRWVLLGVIILVAFVVFFGASCFSARSRRRRGNRPVYGTGWMAPPPGHGPATYYGPGGSNAQYNNSQPPPQYGQAAGYYGQQNGVEMQSPPQAYQPPTGGYAPPPGPPPNKY